MKHNEKQYLLIRKRVAKRAILPIVAILTLSVLGGQWLYMEAKDKIQAIIKPVEASQTIDLIQAPLSNKDYLIQELEANFTKHQAFDIYTMIKACENKSLNPDAKYTNKDGSVDRGIFMINDYWHKEVSNDCAYNLECNIKEGIRIFNERGFKEWSCGVSLGLNK